MEGGKCPGSGLATQGYETEEDYQENRYHTTMSLPGTWVSTPNVDIPLFPDLFEVYNVLFSFTPNEKTRFSTRQKGLDKSIPANGFDVSKSGETIAITGDHDYSRVRFIYSLNESNSYNLFEWTFHQRESNEIVLPLESFEIPEEVAKIFEERNLKLKPSQVNQWYTYEFDVYRHSESIVYEHLFFGNNYLKNEAGDVSWLTYDLR